jgi:hypothetical protein
MHAVLLTGIGGFGKLDDRDDLPGPVLGPGEVLNLLITAKGMSPSHKRISWPKSSSGS